ncbi:hypothetical protein Ahy_A09g046612 isoform B [Arachis hypogaea]|uniref:EGF-like calcium-binding domain-containing protein n=1 Tax=Arachis hypogaea TaxID=3818 RepID=A0A445BQB8_ARAHY|nr:hypothetical protein Ahy_A09g046612 isoform B [Arachis hypogaea]
MGTFKCRVFSVVPFYLFLLTFFTCNHSSASEDECKTAFCGMGTCHETWAGFECDCKHGWSKIQLGPFSSPCVPLTANVMYLFHFFLQLLLLLLINRFKSYLMHGAFKTDLLVVFIVERERVRKKGY